MVKSCKRKGYGLNQQCFYLLSDPCNNSTVFNCKHCDVSANACSECSDGYQLNDQYACAGEY